MHLFTASQRFDYWRKRLILFPICSFLFTATFWMILAFLPLILKQRGFPDPFIGTIFGIYSISTLLLMLPLGMLSDRISPRWILFAGGIATLGHTLGLQAAFQPWHFMALAVLGGMGWATFQIVLMALYLKVIGEENRGKNISYYTAGQFLGFGLGPLLAGMLWGEMDHHWMLLAASLGALVLTVLTLALEDTPPIAFHWGEYRKDIYQPHTLLLLLVYFLYATHLGVEHTSFTLLMRQDLGFSTREIGFTFFAIGVWMFFLSPFAGHRFDVRQKVVPYLMFGIIISSLFQAATGLADSLSTMIGARILHTLGDVPVFLSMGILTAAFFPQGRLGGNSAAVYTIRTIGVFMGNVGAGFLIPWLGYGGVFVASGGFTLILCLGLYPLISRYLGSTAQEREAWARQ